MAVAISAFNSASNRRVTFEVYSGTCSGRFARFAFVLIGFPHPLQTSALFPLLVPQPSHREEPRFTAAIAAIIIALQ